MMNPLRRLRISDKIQRDRVSNFAQTPPGERARLSTLNIVVALGEFHQRVERFAPISKIDHLEKG
jgi:hypothetical protein